MKEVKVSQFCKFPGPRYKSLGPDSGEEFREDVLLPLIAKNPGSDIKIDLDDVIGYGSSFLEEAFGGLIRSGVDEKIVISIVDNLKSDDDGLLIPEIKGYVEEAIQFKKLKK